MIKLSDRKNSFIRKKTYLLFKDGVHISTNVCGIYRFNTVTKTKTEDPFKKCKNLSEVKDVFLKEDKKELSSIFNEGCDFVLVKIDKRGLSNLQQIFPNDLVNSIRFLKMPE